jgi:ABC-type glutathione transport system ATPase component
VIGICGGSASGKTTVADKIIKVRPFPSNDEILDLVKLVLEVFHGQNLSGANPTTPGYNATRSLPSAFEIKSS